MNVVFSKGANNCNDSSTSLSKIGNRLPITSISNISYALENNGDLFSKYSLTSKISSENLSIVISKEIRTLRKSLINLVNLVSSVAKKISRSQASSSEVMLADSVKAVIALAKIAPICLKVDAPLRSFMRY